jgi:hypothetical protein
MGKRKYQGRNISRNEEQNQAIWRPRDENEVKHPGSFSIDDIKKMPAWASRSMLPENARKQKFALCFGYLGSAYHGLQINEGCVTVESVLERAMLLADLISELNFGFLNKVNWTRTGRTDKGVHAISQCVSCKLRVPPGLSGPECGEAIVARLNAQVLCLLCSASQ